MDHDKVPSPFELYTVALSHHRPPHRDARRWAREPPACRLRIGHGHYLSIANREQAMMGAIKRQAARTVATGQRPGAFDRQLGSVDHHHLALGRSRYSRKSDRARRQPRIQVCRVPGSWATTPKLDPSSTVTFLLAPLNGNTCLRWPHTRSHQDCRRNFYFLHDLRVSRSKTVTEFARPLLV